MIYPTEKPTKRYYFVSDGIVYKIASNNDSDGCGITPGFKNDDIIIGECVNAYPSITITYKKYATNNDGTKIDDDKTITKKLWLDLLIETGDKYENGKFSPMSNGNGHKPIDSSYQERFKRLINKDIVEKTSVLSNVNVDVLKRYYPYYLKFTDGTEESAYVKIDGVDAHIINVTGGYDNLFKDDSKIKDAIESDIRTRTLTYANSLGNKIDKVYKKVTLTE